MRIARPLVALFFIAAAAGGARADDIFADVAGDRGIAFVNVNGASGKKYLVETMLGGAAWIDHDGDGFLDLFLVQGHRHPERALDGPPGVGSWGPRGAEEPGDVLLRNIGGKRFEDVTARAGVGDRGYGMGAAAGDWDGDSRPDIYVTNYGRNTLYRNRGDGSFEDVTARAGVGAGGWSSSAVWADLDGDGRLDLYVATYLAYDTRRHGACEANLPGSGAKVPAYCHPHRFEGVPDIIYRNLGDGTFRDVTRESGIAACGGWLAGKGLGVVACDFDGDGDPDLLVANDSVPNNLWRNLGGFRFEDVGLEAGFALNAEGVPQAGMGIDLGDADGDGLLDVYVTNFARETDTLYLRRGAQFLDATIESGLAGPTYLPLAFGCRFLDHDLDGDLDLYVANGHILDNADALHPGEGITYAQPDLLLENGGGGKYRDASPGAGAWFRRALVGRGVAEADFDNDGDPDLLVTNVAGPAALLENRAGDGKAWIGIELRSPPGRGTWHGARVEVEAGGRKQMREAGTGGSYLSAHDHRLRFGLGSAAGPVTVRVRWPGLEGERAHEGLAPGRYHVLERPER
jgi:hypothetical protein